MLLAFTTACVLVVLVRPGGEDVVKWTVDLGVGVLALAVGAASVWRARRSTGPTVDSNVNTSSSNDR